MATFLLVHGAWHGGWCWRRTATILRARGHDVFTPTLTGLGERAHLLTPGTNLSTHIEDITALIEAEEIEDIILCGHSYSGAIIANVADRQPSRIAALVFLDAFIPQPGRSLLDLDAPERQEAILSRVVETEKGAVLPPAPAVIYALASESDREWVDRRCTPHPLVPFKDANELTGAWRSVRRLAYISTERFQPPDFRDIAAGLAGDPLFTCQSITAGHDAMLDEPERLADMLIGHAEAVAGSSRSVA